VKLNKLDNLVNEKLIKHVSSLLHTFLESVISLELHEPDNRFQFKVAASEVCLLLQEFLNVLDLLREEGEEHIFEVSHTVIGQVGVVLEGADWNYRVLVTTTLAIICPRHCLARYDD